MKKSDITETSETTDKPKISKKTILGILIAVVVIVLFLSSVGIITIRL